MRDVRRIHLSDPNSKFICKAEVSLKRLMGLKLVFNSTKAVASLSDCKGSA